MSNENINGKDMQNENGQNQQNEPKKPVKRVRGAGALSFLRRKGFRYGTFNTLLIIIVVTAVILINVGATALDTNWDLRLDLTDNRMFELSAQTLRIIEELTEPITLIGLYPEETLNELTQLLNRYRTLNPTLITVKAVDIDRNPTYINRFREDEQTDIPVNSVIITNADESRYRVVTPNDMFETDYNYDTMETTIRAFIGEQSITNAVVFVTSDVQNNVYFLQGHAETTLDTFSYIVPQLERRNMAVSEIDGMNLGILKPGDTLVIVSPQRDLSSTERDYLIAFLDNGGSLIYMRSATDTYLEGFNSLLALYDITSYRDLVVDNARGTNAGPAVIVPEIRSGPVTDSLIANNLFLVFPYVSSFEYPEETDSNRVYTALLASSAQSYGKTNLESENIEMEEGDLMGPRTVALTMEQALSNGLTTRIAVFGNSYFLTDSAFSTYSGNADMFLNTVSWIQGGGSTAVNIVGKSLISSSLAISTMTQFYAIAATVVLIIPLVVLVIGLVIYLRRRHL